MNLNDCCFERGLKKKRNQKGLQLTQIQDDDSEEIEVLFKDNTKYPEFQDRNIKFKSTKLPASGLSKSGLERLKIEFRFLRHLLRLLYEKKDSEALELVQRYYQKQICMNTAKNAKGGEPCGNTNWCS